MTGNAFKDPFIRLLSFIVCLWSFLSIAFLKYLSREQTTNTVCQTFEFSSIQQSNAALNYNLVIPWSHSQIHFPFVYTYGTNDDGG